jgi:hypothetical protein
LVRLNELRHKSKEGRKSKSGGLIAEEVKEYRSLVHELVVEQVEKATPRPALMTAEANIFRAWPLREMAKEEGIDENDPPLLWALEAQEKADWRTNPGQHQKDVKDLKTDRGHREEVDGHQSLGVILQKCAPSLRRRLAAAHHVICRHCS